MTDFLERFNTEGVDVEVVRERYPDAPEDALEEMARQLAVAQPLLRRYHLLHDKTPDHSMARATAHEEVEAVMDEIVALDLSELGDTGFVRPEYQCPNCQHEWSGAPNSYTGWGDTVSVPKGTVNNKGRLGVSKYGPVKWPRRGWGNAPIDEEKPSGGKRQRTGRSAGRD
jgi:hypothetical protein